MPVPPPTREHSTSSVSSLLPPTSSSGPAGATPVRGGGACCLGNVLTVAQIEVAILLSLPLCFTRHCLWNKNVHVFSFLCPEIDSTFHRLSSLLTVHTSRFNVLVSPLRATILEVSHPRTFFCMLHNTFTQKVMLASSVGSLLYATISCTCPLPSIEN